MFEASGGRRIKLVLVVLLLPIAAPAQDIIAPPGSSTALGSTVKVLPNGNFQVTDPNFSVAGASQIRTSVWLALRRPAPSISICQTAP